MAAVQTPATNGSYLQQTDPQSFPANSTAASPAPATAQTHAPPQQSSPLDVPKDEVGWLFVEQYYTTLNKTPDRLHLFYNKKSSFVWGTEGENLPVAHGRNEIQERITAQGLKNCKVRVSNVDSHASINDGIVIQVLGEMSNNGLPNRKFTQTFLLAVQPNGYYVHNDIFRYMKDDDDIEEGEELEYVEEDVAEPVEEAAEVVAEESVEAIEVENVGIVEAVEDSTLQETSKVEVEVEGDKIKVDETYAVEPAVPAAEDQGLPPPPSVNGTAQSANGAPSVEEAELEPVSEPKAEELAVSEAAEPAPEVSQEQELEVEEEKPVPAPPVVATVPAKEPERAPAPAPAPVPSRPKTWASLVSGNTAAPAATAAVTPATQPQQPPASATPVTPAAPATPTTPTTPGGGSQWQNVDGPRRHTKPTSTSNAPSGSQTQAFIKGFNESVNIQALRDALSKFGTLRSFDVNRLKTFAFVEFETPSQFAAARNHNPHRIGDATLFVEERRSNGSNYNSGGRGGRGNFPRDSGRGHEFRPSGRGGGGNRGSYSQRGGARTTPAGGN